MRRHKERKGNHESDVFEGTSARTRPYSFEEIMSNRKNKKVSQYHDIDAGGEEDSADGKLEVLQTDKDEKGSKYSSHGVGNKISVNILDVSSRAKERSNSVKLESVIVGKVGISPVEPKVKSEVVDNTRNKAALGERSANGHKKIEGDERPGKNAEDPVGYSHLKNSLSKRRIGDHHDEKSERDVKRKERNPSDQKRNDDYLKAELKRKVKNIEGKDRFGAEVEKALRKDKTVHRDDLRKHSDRDIVNKHSISKRDSELSERRERKGSPPTLHEQHSKRRRRSSSREREHKRDRDQKLSLHEVQKHTSYHKQNHTVSLPHSSKDRSGKYVSELDRSSKFTNGSTGHKREHNESTDKLGGYSPRKRRSEDLIQIPPGKGTGKKRVGWDTPHTESDFIMSSALLPIPSVQSNQSNMQHSVGVLAVSSSQPESSLLNFNVQSAMLKEPIDSVQLTQSTQPMRRLIIENVPAPVTVKDVMDCLNKLLLPSGANLIQGTQPCISCVMHDEKRQALVEFLTPEYASTALSFNGSSLLGSDFKIRRPKDFVTAKTATPEKSMAVVNAVSDVVEDSPHKIFIGGISKNLSPKMLMEIASAFGPLKAYKFLFENDADEPRAFLQYVDQSITAKACAGLNGMKFGGQTLTAVQATTDKPSSDMKRSPTYAIPETAKPLLDDPTEVLVLKNVFHPERFSSLSQPEIEEVLEDVRLECTRFGTVKSINVVTCNQSSAASLEIIELGVAELVPTERVGHDNDSGDLNTQVRSSKQMAEEDIENNVQSDNPNVEDPPNIKAVDTNIVDDKDKSASDCTLSNEIFSARSEASDKPSTIIEETRNTNYEAEANIGGCELISVGDSKQSLCSSAQPGVRTGPVVEKKGSGQLEGHGSVLLPGSICIEYKRSEATCRAAHCFNGRVYDNRFVSVEYLSLDVYTRKFRK